MDLEDAQYPETVCHSGQSLQLGNKCLGFYSPRCCKSLLYCLNCVLAPCGKKFFKIIVFVFEYMPTPPPRAMIVKVITRVFENRDIS